MYYLYKKSKSSELPKFHYMFKSFEEFYKIANLLEVPLIGSYYIQIKSDSYKDIMNFLNIEHTYSALVVYIEMSESLLEYVALQKPQVSMLDSKSNFEVFKELIEKYRILFDKNCIRLMYSAIGHSYADMDEALELLQKTYPNTKITKNELNKLFVIDDTVYPRSVCIMYIRMDRWRQARLRKCIDYFGNDLVLYSMRKTTRKLLDEKIKYLKTGRGSYLARTLPAMNIVKLAMALDYERRGFMDVTTILNLYEKGETINDFVQKRTVSFADEKHYVD